MKSHSPWFNHGFWNTLEHVLTRSADALTSMVLLWVLSPEIFSKLALAQAAVAPLLLVFVSPETVLYRDFSKWEQAGLSSLTSRLRSLRLFGWLKAGMAILLAAGIAVILPEGVATSGFSTRFSALIWAFSLALGPQFSGADREYLRLSLRLRQLNALSILQKGAVLTATLVVALFFKGDVKLLAFLTAMAMAVSAAFAYWQVSQALRERRLSSRSVDLGEGPNFIQTICDAITSFSIWNHISGVVMNWIQTMDLFFLGILHFPAREVGLYAVALKLANLSLALPTAFSNLFSIWIGRRLGDSAGMRREQWEVRRLTLVLAIGSLLQALVMAVLAPAMISWFSHGRWIPLEQDKILRWFLWILSGNAILSSTFIFGSWLSLRGSIRELVFKVSVPWMILSLVIYGGAARVGGPDFVAIANLVVPVVLAALFWGMWRTSRQARSHLVDNPSS